MLLSCTAKRLKEMGQRLSTVRTDMSQQGQFHRRKIKKSVILIFTIICILKKVRYITQCLKIQQKVARPMICISFLSTKSVRNIVNVINI